MPNKARKELIQALKNNGGYSSGYRDRYAIAFNVKVYGYIDSHLVEQGIINNIPTVDINYLKDKGFSLDSWIKDNQESIDSIDVIESIRTQVTDSDCYNYNQQVDKYHKVTFDFSGRSGGYLVVTDFDGKSLQLSNDDLIEQLELLDNDKEQTTDSYYSNKWCRNLLVMLNQWENDFSRDSANQAYSYEVGFQLSQRLETIIESMQEKDKVQYWNSRDIVTK